MDADGDMLTVTAEVKDSMIVELSDIDENGMLTVTALAVGMTSVVPDGSRRRRCVHHG